MTETDRIRNHILNLEDEFTSRQVIVDLDSRNKMTISLISEMQREGSIKRVKGKTKRCGYTFAVNHEVDSGEEEIDLAETGMSSFIYGGDAQRMTDNLHYEVIA